MDFSGLKAYLSGISASYGIPAWDLSVMKNHHEVFRMMDGFSDSARTVPVSRDDLYWIYSTSKPITCTACLRLVESGKIHLEDEVSRYLPEFGSMQVRTPDGTRPAHQPMRIRHLLTMTSGLDYDLDTPAVQALIRSASTDTLAYMRALAEKPLDFDPGTGFQYSLSHDVLGAVIEIASGMRFGEYLKKNIFEPLGMRHTGFRPDPDESERFSELYDASGGVLGLAKSTPAENWPYESGGGGLFSCTDDYRIFADALANRGTAANGYRLLLPETIDLMRTNQLNYAQNRMFHKNLNQRNKDGYGYGFGVKTLVDPIMSPGPLGEFGWDGAAGSLLLADPENSLSIFYVQHILGFPVVYDEIMVRIRDLTYDAVL